MSNKEVLERQKELLEMIDKIAEKNNSKNTIYNKKENSKNNV